MATSNSVRWTLISVIILIVSVHWISCRAVFVRQKPGSVLRSTVDNNNDARETSEAAATLSNVVATEKLATAAERSHKHLKFLKAPNPAVVDSVKRRMKARMKGRKPDQSNERNLWTSHPKNLDWVGPDSDENVIGVIKSLGI